MKSVVFKINEYDKNKKNINNDIKNNNNNNSNTIDNTINTKIFSSDNSNKPIKLVENIYYFKK